MQFDDLITTLEDVHHNFSERAVQQVNTALTIRNWLIGFYIVEYEQNGEDRAVYGDELMKRIVKKTRHIKGLSQSNLFSYRQFYLVYTWFNEAIIADKQHVGKFQTVSGKFQTPSGESVSVAAANEVDSLRFPPERLLNGLTFSHFIELIRLDSDLKRRFYEIETLKNSWSVRALMRATSTLLFERTGLSTDKAAVISRIANEQSGERLPETIADRMRSPYILEFLGLAERAEYSENDLETAILTHLQEFLTELGRGFCFEARQKRITFGNTHYHIDLVFYHRILKCHVLIDLKLGKFDHADAGQMTVYLNYFKKNEMTDGDNPPVGLILCADQDDVLVEYATSGLSNDVLVSKYLVQLPDKETLANFLKAELN